MALPAPRRTREGGFTLIEILIVISIIAILMSLMVGGIMVARNQGYKTTAQHTVNGLSAALDRFYSEMKYYPKSDADVDDNDFPALFEALLGDPPPKGKGGRSSPYLDVKEEDIHVWDEDQGTYRKATFDERYDSDVEKYMVDPWGNPYWYRENKTKERASFMGRPTKADIWSVGPDGINSRIPGAEELPEEKIDDIGNW